MRLPWHIAVISTFYSFPTLARFSKPSYDTHNYYVIHHDPAYSSLADVATLFGVEVVEQVGELADHWLVRAELPSLETRDSENPRDIVLDTYKKLRRGETHISARGEDLSAAVRHLSRQTPRQRAKRAPPPIRPSPETLSSKVAERLGIEDPLFGQQWHLVNDENPEHMMNVVPVWDMGITGEGVITSLVDDGLDYDNEDLKDNFDAINSYDFNDHQKLPTPKLSDDHHGTRCAGQVAAGKNAACGLGIAYKAKVAGIRILSGAISDADEAASLNYGFQNVSIYSCSWGPPDNGQSMEGPSYIIQQAVLNGINKGRDGKGSIFVFASGNGAGNGDQCNFDGYTNSIYSVTISAIDHKGLHPYYSETCAANMVVAYSSGSGKHIVTTDKGQGKCATTHGGTSAAAPNAAGVFTLAMEARPDLTWRDIQYLCIETARIINPDDDWETIASGRKYSYQYGFGALDAYEYIKAAQDWSLVGPQTWFNTHTVQLGEGTMDDDGNYTGGEPIVPGGLTSTITVTQDDLDQHNFNRLEHINVKVWIDHSRRGDVEVEVVSPNGIKSMLAGKRSRDADTTGYPGWIFMSVKHWGEDPVGDWTIRVFDQKKKEHSGRFLGWNMVFWGEAKDASKAKLFELPPESYVFPPKEEVEPIQSVAQTTKSYAKPTVPPDIPTAQATADPTAVVTPTPAPTSSDSAPSATSTPTMDEGWFSGMSNLVANPKWFFGAAGAVAIFSIGAAVFFWRRRRASQARSSEYSTLLGGDDVQMSAVGPGAGGVRPRTKELYDAFGELSDEDEDADEETHLRGAHSVSEGIGFHSGFLDDEDGPLSAGGAPTHERYRDEPEIGGRTALSPAPDSPATSSGSGSGGSGSWQHPDRDSPLP